MSQNRRGLRDLMIWIAVIAIGFGALAERQRRKTEGPRRAAERTRQLNAARAAGQGVAVPAVPPGPGVVVP